MENYIVSARKYRPTTFESVVGQRHITDTLRNAIERKQLAHAYLFCGPRGVGKTTCARIFAKSINCLSPRTGGVPCGECESCVGFESGRSMNIHELDAASNNSVDDIRTLIEQVRITPQVGRYSLFIIDEVHMLSTAAFNAFLKTLEEPPAHAIFILATTERHKILPTILSRCQCYDFNRIKVEDGAEYLRYIANTEGVEVDEESLNLIAQKADGGMRDALSMFDKAVSFAGNKLDFKVVAQTLGVVDYDTYFSLTDSLLEGDYAAALLTLDGVLGSGFALASFVTGYARHLRDLLVAKSPSTLNLMELTPSLVERYGAQAARCDVAFLFDSIALLTSIDGELRRSSSQRLVVELGLMKMAGLGKKKSDDVAPQLPPLTPQPPKEVAKVEVAKVEVKIEQPKVEEVKAEEIKDEPKPESKPEPEQPKLRHKPLFDLRGELAGVGKPKAVESSEEVEGRVVDASSMEKLTRRREAVIECIAAQRPRFRQIFEAMSVVMEDGVPRLSVEVPTEELQRELLQSELEMMHSVVKVAGVDGYVGLKIVVNEQVVPTRPVKLEDKMLHFTTHHPLTLDLANALDLQADS